MVSFFSTNIRVTIKQVAVIVVGPKRASYNFKFNIQLNHGSHNHSFLLILLFVWNLISEFWQTVNGFMILSDTYLPSFSWQLS